VVISEVFRSAVEEMGKVPGRSKRFLRTGRFILQYISIVIKIKGSS
jgi:hypothetical protein